MVAVTTERIRVNNNFNIRVDGATRLVANTDSSRYGRAGRGICTNDVLLAATTRRCRNNVAAMAAVTVKTVGVNTDQHVWIRS